MRVLLVHPEDDLEHGPWISRTWERVIDLGKAGEETYADASKTLGPAISGLDSLRDNFSDMRRVRELVGLGSGSMQDDCGLDWWELTSIEIHQQFEIAFLMGELAKSLAPGDEVFVSRPSFHADVLRWLLGSRLQTFASAVVLEKRGLAHYLRIARKFPPGQLLEIFWDKTDPGYQLRGKFSRRPKTRSAPSVLLPTCYGNVTRTAVAYAETLPEANFLLVTTRRSGWRKDLPPNVSAAWLRQYASHRSREAEHSDLVARWQRLQTDLQAVQEFRVLSELGSFDGLPQQLAVGLEIRDAWRNVFASEPVSAVICADDSNPSTHIPLLLAKHRGLPAVACHHGALDGRYMFKRSHADVLLAKGRMEEDYLVRQCGVPVEMVEVGAPAVVQKLKPAVSTGEKSSIVFFSEAYAVAGGRARSFYRDILPPLADLARAEGKKLIVKLHPSESVTERRRIVSEVLSPAQKDITRVLGGALVPELLDDAWFGVTVMSTVVVECAMRGLPCFLCSWLEAWPYGYVAQFGRYEVGIRLNDRDEIRKIPAILGRYRADARIRENCWIAISRQRFCSLLGMSTTAHDPAQDVITKTA